MSCLNVTREHVSVLFSFFVIIEVNCFIKENTQVSFIYERYHHRRSPSGNVYLPERFCKSTPIIFMGFIFVLEAYFPIH